MSNATVSIKITGDKGSGKTTLLHEIGSFLADKGYNVECIDCGTVVMPNVVGMRPDQRTVRVEVDET